MQKLKKQKNPMPPFRKINDIPSTLKPKAIENAVDAFIRESHSTDVPLDANGLYTQLIENIAGIVVFKIPSRYFWMAEEDGEVIAFALTHVAKDVDNSLCYWQTVAWVHPRWRGKPVVKEWNRQLEEDAKANFCKHILIPSSRNTEAYCRFLGKGWHPYLVLLKKDLS